MGKVKKRKGPKSTRAGCLLCKPHKRQGVKNTKEGLSRQEKLARLREKESVVEYDKQSSSEEL